MFIRPEWPVPVRVKSLLTDRLCRESCGTYGFNLATHVGDTLSNVEENRAVLVNKIKHPVSWLNQIHSVDVIELNELTPINKKDADGVATSITGMVCGVLTADCLPLLICNQKGDRVAAIHAGWRGMGSGIISKAIASFEDSAQELSVWLGPAISQPFFEVGQDVYDFFSSGWESRGITYSLDRYFQKSKKSDKKYYADLFGLARCELNSIGVRKIYGGTQCTWKNNDQFYSFRKEGKTGRFASLIWIEK